MTGAALLSPPPQPPLNPAMPSTAVCKKYLLERAIRFWSIMESVYGFGSNAQCVDHILGLGLATHETVC